MANESVGNNIIEGVKVLISGSYYTLKNVYCFAADNTPFIIGSIGRGIGFVGDQMRCGAANLEHILNQNPALRRILFALGLAMLLYSQTHCNSHIVSYNKTNYNNKNSYNLENLLNK